MKRTITVITVSLGLVALAPSFGHAEGQGNCKIEARVCEFGGAGCRDDNGDRGQCRQIGNQCTCFVPTDRAKENAIKIIDDSTATAKSLLEATTTVHAFCDQLIGLLRNVELSARRFQGTQGDLGPVRFVDAKLMMSVDMSLARLPVIGSLFSSSGCPATFNPTPVILILQDVKDDLADRLLTETNGAQ